MPQQHNKTLIDFKVDIRLNSSILSSLHKGFNSLTQIDFPQFKIKNRRTTRALTINNHKTITKQSSNKKKARCATESSFDEDCPILHNLLQENKFKLSKLKTEVDLVRQYQFNDYIKKGLRYQQLLNLNQTKKKHLPTLNTKVGEVVKKSAVQNFSKNIYYQIKYTKLGIQGWKPQSREGHSCIIFKNMAIIIGGHCSHPFATANIYSIDKNQWIKQINTQSARSYHTSLLYKNRFIISFGGMGVYDVSRKCRGCFNTVNLIDLSSNTVRSMNMNNQQSVQARRSHSAVLMSKNMIVFGGMNSKKQHLNDFIYLDLKQLRWYHKQYRIQGKQLTQNLQTGIAKHSAICIFKQRKHYPLYSAQYQDHQGIYIFGGFYGNGQQNIAIQICFNKYVPYFRKVEYSGLPPSSIDPILEKLNDDVIIIISGDSHERELRLFKIKQKQFTIIPQSSSKLLGGVGSTITRHNNQFYVFFGLNDQGYIGAISKFSIQEKIKEKQDKKKKIQHFNQGLGWKDSNWELTSVDSQDLNGII